MSGSDHECVCGCFSPRPEVREIEVLALAVLVLVLGAFAGTAWLIARVDRQASVAFDDQPDLPTPFGTDMAWLAVKTNDAAAVASALNLQDCSSVSWAHGVEAIHDSRTGDSAVFVAPAVHGWVLVAGLALPQPIGSGFADKTTPLLAELSRSFGEAQYFLAYSPLDYFSWVRAVGGRISRAFAIGDEGVIMNAGRRTAAEHALGLRFFEVRGVCERAGDGGGAMILAPTAEQVTALAGHWSIDPMALGRLTGARPSTGILARTPAQWRPERVLRDAA